MLIFCIWPQVLIYITSYVIYGNYTPRKESSGMPDPSLAMSRPPAFIASRRDIWSCGWWSYSKPSTSMRKIIILWGWGMESKVGRKVTPFYDGLQTTRWLHRSGEMPLCPIQMLPDFFSLHPFPHLAQPFHKDNFIAFNVLIRNIFHYNITVEM